LQRRDDVVGSSFDRFGAEQTTKNDRLFHNGWQNNVVRGERRAVLQSRPAICKSRLRQPDTVEKKLDTAPRAIDRRQEAVVCLTRSAGARVAVSNPFGRPLKTRRHYRKKVMHRSPGNRQTTKNDCLSYKDRSDPRSDFHMLS
jgi:hypothetical protein